MAYAIARAEPTYRNLFLMLVILPFWTSFLLRVYAWIGLLKNNGVINNVLMRLGIIDEPTRDDADEFRRVHRHRLFLPAIHDPAAVLEPREASTTRCSRPRRISAASPSKAFMRITLPLSFPGIVAGSLLVFIPGGR